MLYGARFAVCRTALALGAMMIASGAWAQSDRAEVENLATQRLEVARSCNYEMMWRDKGSGADKDVAIYIPVPAPEFFVVGGYAIDSYKRDRVDCMTVVRPDPRNIAGGRELLAPPVDWELVWADKGSGADLDGSVWQAVPPSRDFVCLGSVGQDGYDKPRVPKYRCVNACLVADIAASGVIWTDKGSGADKDLSLYSLPNIGSFVGRLGYGPGPPWKDLKPEPACAPTAEESRIAAAGLEETAVQATRGTAQAARPTAPAELDAPDPRRRNYALVIGNAEYDKLPNLRTPVRDAEAVAEVLVARYDFDEADVTLLLNATRASILHQFTRLRDQLGADDRLLIYYAGHGQIDSRTDEGFWQPVDADPTDEVNWIANGDVKRYLAGMAARHVLVVADSCFSGTLTRGTEPPPDRTSDRFFAETDERFSRKVITSGGVEPVSDGGSGGHSVFAYYLLRTLRRNNRPYASSPELFADFDRAVTNNSDQNPELATIPNTGDEGGGDFFFVLRQ